MRYGILMQNIPKNINIINNIYYIIIFRNTGLTNILQKTFKVYQT